jgi:hypothetical protein
LNLDRTTVIAGLPIKTVRDAIREMKRHDNNDYGWTVEKLGTHLKISATHAEWLCETLREQGVLKRAPQPDTRWSERGIYYRVSDSGTRFINASMLKRIDRARVDKLLAGLLERVKEVNANNDLCCFVNEIRLFGSAIDANAESFSDVDICYVLARRKTPPKYKEWTDWSIARAEQSGRKGLQFLSMLYYGDAEVMRILKNGSPYLSLHDLDDVVGIGADSTRLYIAPEGAIEAEDGGTSGQALSQDAMKAVRKKDKKASPATVIADEPPKERMISAIKSLAFDILRAIDESTRPEPLEHSIEVAHERIKAYRRENATERVVDILRDALAVDVIEQKKAAESERFVFSGERERWTHDGTNEKQAAENGMKHAVIALLKCTISGRYDRDHRDGMVRHFGSYRRAEYDEWKYRQEHGYDWYGPEMLSDRAVVTIQRIADRTGEKLDKQALKTLHDKGFIKPFRRTKWRLTAKGEVAITYHRERDAWNKERAKRNVPN